MPGVDIKKDDTVKVISGKDLGHQGRVVRVDPVKRKVLVEGAARAKKHTRTGAKRSKGSTQALQQGGIIDMEQMIDISNVQILCGACGQPTRVGHIDVDGNKVRICRKCEREL